MNVIVSNKQKKIIDNANIDAIKDLNGLFNVDDLISKFRNYFFSKMILDATSVINFTSNEVLQKLVNGIGSERLIIFLPSNLEPPKEFTDKLVSLKIYNFSNKIDDIVSFINNPRNGDYFSKNVQNSENSFYVDNTIKENEASNTVYQDERGNDENNDLSFSETDDSLDISNDYQSNENNNVFNSRENYNDINVESNSLLNNTFSNSEFNQEDNNEGKSIKRIIGIKNVTMHAGSTTLIYLLSKELKEKNINVLSLEVNKNDFKYFQDKNMLSVNSNNILNTINTSNADVILIDLNDYDNLSICSDVLYLVEPSIIKLNKLMMENRFAFRDLHDKKVILNKSVLSENDIKLLSKEANMGMFYNIPPINDRIKNNVLSGLINKLGIK